MPRSLPHLAQGLCLLSLISIASLASGQALTIVNPSFEDGGGSLTGWAKSSGTNKHAAVTPPTAFSTFDPPAAHHGTYYDAGNALGAPDNETSIFQRIDLSANSVEIDAGRARVDFTGYGYGEATTASGVSTYNDSAIMSVSFFDAASGGTQLGATVYSNWASAQNVWTELNAAGVVVPTGTQSVELAFHTQRRNGSQTDAGGDDFSGSITIDNFARETVRVDLNGADAKTQQGWKPWDVGSIGANDVASAIMNFTELGGFTVELNDFDIRDRGIVTGRNLLSELIDDGVKNSSTNNLGTADLAFTMTLSDLDAGDYALSLVLHDADSDNDLADIFVDTGSGFVQVADDIMQSTGDGFVDPAMFDLLFSAIDGQPVTIGFASGTDNGGSNEVSLNGFELTRIQALAVAVPEPASIAIWTLLGVVVAGLVWRRHKA